MTRVVSCWVLLLALVLPVFAQGTDLNNFDDLAQYYVQQRECVAPLVPPLLFSIIDDVEAQIAKGDYSFQEQDGWYFPFADGPVSYAANSEIAGNVSEGTYLIVYEDLATAVTRIATPEGKVLAELKAEEWPNLSGLSQDAYDARLLAELNKRSIVLWVLFQNAPPEDDKEEEEEGGGMLMSSGGSNELEIIDFSRTNDGMLVTFAWPASFTNRLDIYSTDTSNYNGFGSWQLADSGYGTSGTNQLAWVDIGQLGRGSAFESGLRFYTAGAGSDADADGDGYSDAYEQLVLNSDPTDGDTDNDGISDGPFDPDGDGSTVAGPDPNPLNASVLADTDGDGIDDSTDPDDDNDGMADGSDPQPLIPRAVAVYKVVSVETNNPAGDDNGTELFDLSSAGRMLDYAEGSDAAGGFGVLQGGIYFNYDASNLYIGVAGFEGTTNNSLMLLLDTDGTNGGAASLSGISGTPYGFGNANNLSFVGTNFTPNIGILLGSRYGDGQNFPNFNLGPNDIGQGVFLLTATTTSNFPGFSSSTDGAPISQWGDRGDTSANAGMEIAIALTNAGLSGGSTFKAAAIIMSSESGGNRYFSKEAYGASVSGSLDGYGQFGYNAVTLVGAEVYLGETIAPAYSDAPDFDEDDVILQGYFWNVPRPAKTSYSTMTVAGTFNGWNAGLNNMSLIGDHTWEYIHNFGNPTSGVAFKFAANGGWGDNWGQNGQTDFFLPMTSQTGHYYGADIAISGTISGPVRFRFTVSDSTTNYSIDAVSTSTVTMLLPGISTQYWYSYVRQLAESNFFSRFTWMWMPPPQKSASGVDSVGYDPFDYYDVGTYHEKFTIPTRYGSETELKGCVDALRSRGISPIIDLVLNHNAGGYGTEGGSGGYNFAYGNHDTFEKIDPAGNNSNGYFNAGTTEKPFHYQTDFGPDVNVRHPYQRLGLKSWGSWVTAKVGYQGYRWDIPINIDPWFVSEFMDSGLMKGRPGIMEWWELESDGTVGEMETFLALTDYRATLFDMPLREHLKELCNESGSNFDIQALTHAGLVNLDPQWAVPFAESHDTIRPYGDDSKTGISQDKDIALAFILLSEGTPMVAISDYLYGASVNIDTNSSGWSTNNLKAEIDAFIDIRRTYAGGTTSYLSTQNTNDLLVMKRNGNEAKPGCILVINDNDTTTLYDTGVSTGWANTNLVDVLDTNHVVSTDSGGLPTPGLSAPPRHYRVYIRQGDLQ